MLRKRKEEHPHLQGAYSTGVISSFLVFLTSEGRAIFQRDLDRLEGWSSMSCMKFHKDKALHLGQRTHRAQERPGSAWLGSSPAEWSLGAVGDHKLNGGQQCTAGGRDKLDPGLHLQGHYQWRQKCDCPTLLNSCQATQGVLCPGLVPAVQKIYRQTGEGPKEGHEGDQRAGESALCGKTERDRSFHPGENKALGGPLHNIQYLKDGYKETEGLPSKGATWRRQGNGHKLHWQRLHLDIRKTFFSKNNK